MRRTMSCEFKIKKAGKGSITIEGLANANTVDRMKEIILPSAWSLDNYKKNPVVLFDHGHDPTFGFMPVGRAVEVEARDEGLYTKIEMSSSKSEKISAVRDLVEEGILKTFSVGFDPKSTAKSDTNPDVMEITKAELIETSIVPIPMNQDSTFTMLHCRKAYWLTPLAKRWYDVFMDRVDLHKKGAWVAAAVHQRLYDLMEVGEIRNKDSALKFVAEESGLTLATVNKAMAGHLVPVPGPLLKAFAGVLRVDSKTLEALNKGDVALLERVMNRDDNEGGDSVKKKKAPAKKAAEVAPPEKDPAEEAPKKGDKAMGQICCIVVPKESVADAAEAASKVEGAGYATDKMEEDDTNYMFWQMDKDGAGDMAQALEVDLGDGVVAIVTPSKAYGDKPKDEEAPKKAVDPADAGEDIAEGENPDEDIEEEAEAAQVDELNKIIEMVKGGGSPEEVVAALEEVVSALQESAAADPAKSFQKNVAATDDNPYLKAADAQTAMLGAILNELKGMGEGMKGIADLTLALSKEAGDAKADDTSDDKNTEGKDDEEAKSLDSLRSYQRDLDRKLKRLNV